MNISFLLIVLALALVGYVAHVLAMRHLFRPPSKEERRWAMNDAARSRAAVRLERLSGKSPLIWVPKKYGPLGVRSFRAADYFEAMRCWAPRNLRRQALANVGGGFFDGGLVTKYPSDVIPGSASNPYLNRYVLVAQAPSGTTLGATLAPSYAISSDDICNIFPAGGAGGATPPLGIMQDDVGNTALDSVPYGGNVFVFCGGGRSTMQAISDSLIVAGRLLVPSTTTAGFLGQVPNIAGVYWCVGMSGNTSEGASTEIDLLQNLFPISVDEIT